MSAAVSFVIPNWNGRDLLAATLRSIRAQTLPALEIVVVDNGSEDGAPRVAQEAGAKVLLLGKNRGFSFAVNRGLEAAQGDLVAVLNNDVELEPDWTACLAQGLENSGAWFAIGKLLNYARRDRIDGVGDAVCLGGAAWRLGHGRADSPLFDTPRGIFFPSATAVLARRTLFERAGTFEEAFFTCLEDVDFGLRAALLNLPGIYSPEAVAYHRGSATVGVWSPWIVRWLTRNQILLLAKFYPWTLTVHLWRRILVAQGLWALLALRHGCGLAYIRGLAAGCRASLAVRRAGGAWRDGKRLAEVLLHSEAELLRVQRATGWDRYWRWYFRLAPHPQEPAS